METVTSGFDLTKKLSNNLQYSSNNKLLGNTVTGGFYLSKKSSQDI